MNKIICIVGFGLYCVVYGLGVEAVGIAQRFIALVLLGEVQ